MESFESTSGERARGFFGAVVRNARPILCLSVAVLGIGLAGLTRLEKDTRSKAYMASNHPAYLGLDRVEELFGLGDGVVVAVLRDPGESDLFNPTSLGLIAWITEKARSIPGVDPERVRSLSTVRSIRGSVSGIEIEPFLETRGAAPAVADQAEADRVRDAVLGTELFLDKLVSRDGRATLIAVELLDAEHGAEVYARLLEVAKRAPRGAGDRVHVAGIGAYNALVGDYVDADAARLNPVAALVIVVMLFVGYRRVRAVSLALLVAGGSVVIGMGTMGFAGSPVYGITSSMSVILIAVSVCDAIHILGDYYLTVRDGPSRNADEIVVATLSNVWRPVLITSLTSIAGFLALSVASPMPPMRAYGIFASIGVVAALLLSVLTLPALLSLLPVQTSPALDGDRPDRLANASQWLASVVLLHPRRVTGLFAFVGVLGLLGLARLEIEEDTVKYLSDDEPLREAELEIDAALGGISNLDIIFESTLYEGILEPAALQRIASLQDHLEDHPQVTGTFSVVDYLRQMHQAMNDGDESRHRLPATSDLVAQYLLLYSSNADPAELEEVIDYEYRRANLRVSLEDGRWETSRSVRQAAAAHLSEMELPAGLETTLAGWGNVRFHLREDVAESSFQGAALATLVVLAATIGCFASGVAGLYALLPVGAALLLQFAVMGLSGIWLSLITSMGSALAIGLSVDFAVHTIDRLRLLSRGSAAAVPLTLEEAIRAFFAGTGRALILNALALFLGFGVLTTSLVPAMREFGVVLVVCIATGFTASMLLLPSLVWLARPASIVGRLGSPTPSQQPAGQVPAQARNAY
ncbi:MAG: MMPL family transporter [Myxococcota bacterium]|nr:MMPL family transporter [Myxococcota bacterium]